MSRHFFRIVLTLLVAGFLFGGGLVETASACPMCKAAAEEDNAQAQAYMYSILFMLAVPGLLFGGITAALIRLGLKEAKAMKELEGEMPVAGTAENSAITSEERELVEV